MARMIPSTIHSSVQSGAERMMFRIIENAPHSEDWICLHSLGLARHVNKRRGEIDFVILCNHGIFVLEIKGGKVRRKDGRWKFTNKQGRTFDKHEGPFEQASTAMFTLEQEVKKNFRDSPLSRAMFGYGVVLPDVKFEEVGCDMDPALVYDKRDRNVSFDNYINRLADFTRSVQPGHRKGLKKDKVIELADFLRGDFDLVPSMNTVIEDTHDQLTVLTKHQFQLLDYLETRPRVIVEGAAGSGKTLLAIESARRHARRGKSVLFLCYNKNLAAKIRSKINEEEYLGKIEAKTLHSHCRSLISSSSLEASFKEDSEGVSPKELFDNLYPEYATLALYEGETGPYDMLIVDEAQDVLTAPILDLMAGSIKDDLKSGSWQLYLDSNNQASIYGKLDPAVVETLRPMADYHVLTVNCRNTKHIALHTVVLSGARRQASALTDGPPVEYISYEEDNGWLDRLEQALKGIQNDSVKEWKVVVLVPKVPTPDVVAAFQVLGIEKLGDENVPRLGTPDFNKIVWSPVSGFKGLESDVVILAGIDDIENDWWKAVTYVGMSRARTRLIVILEKSCDPIRATRMAEEITKGIAESEPDL